MSQSYKPALGEQIRLQGPGGVVPTVMFYIVGGFIISVFQGSGSPEGVVAANPSSTFSDGTNGNLWLKVTGTGNTGWFVLNIPRGAGSPEGVVASPPGTLYLRTAGLEGQTLYVKESGTGSTGWKSDGGTIFFPTDSPTNAKFRTDKQLGIGKAPGAFGLDVSGAANFDAAVRFSGLSAGRPMLTNGSKDAVSGLVDIGSGSNVQGTGLGTGDVLGWDGSKVVAQVGITGQVSEITSVVVVNVVTSVALSGVIPPGLTLDVSTADTTYVNGAQHDVTKGLVTS